MLSNPAISLLLFLIPAVIYVESKESYVNSRNDDRRMDSRSSRDSDRNIRRVLDTNSIRFGRRSDLPPLFNSFRLDDEDEEFARMQRAGLNHLRFGRGGGGSNFVRFGRSQNLTSPTSNFLRSGKGHNGNHMRFGRTDNFLRFGRGDQNFMRFGKSLRYKRGSDGKRPSDSFMRFGRDYEDGFEMDDEDDKVEIVDDVSLAELLNEIALKLDNGNSEPQ